MYTHTGPIRTNKIKLANLDIINIVITSVSPTTKETWSLNPTANKGKCEHLHYFYNIIEQIEENLSTIVMRRT